MSPQSCIPSSSRRPQIQRTHHTWHGHPYTGRSHFEDFMHEIGIVDESSHLCCIPRQERPAITPSCRPHSRRALSLNHPSTASNSRILLSQEPHIAPDDHAAPSALATAANPGSSSPKAATPPRRFILRFFICHQSEGRDLKSPAQNTVFDIDAQALYSTAQPDAIERRWTPLPQPPALSNHSKHAQSEHSTQASTQSLSRASSFASLSTLSSSEGPETPKGDHSPLPTPLQERKHTLSDLEHNSRLRINVSCVNCKRTGSNFPSCAKCGDRWCSRECRLEGMQSKVHSCHRRSEMSLDNNTAQQYA